MAERTKTATETKPSLAVLGTELVWEGNTQTSAISRFQCKMTQTMLPGAREDADDE